MRRMQRDRKTHILVVSVSPDVCLLGLALIDEDRIFELEVNGDVVISLLRRLVEGILDRQKH